MNKVGTIKVGELDLPLYVEQGDIDKIVAKFQVINPPVVVPPPTLPTPPPVSTGIKIIRLQIDANATQQGGTKKVAKWEVTGGSGQYAYKLGDFIGYGTNIWISPNTDWTVEIYDTKNPESKTELRLLSKENGQSTDISFIQTDQPVIAPEPPASNSFKFAEVGQTYFSHYKPKLHFPTRENAFEAQVFRCEKDGVVIYEYDRPQGWNTESSYQGNHPQESNFAVSEGIYKFYFKNTGTKPIIVGITSGNAYEFYDIPGTLAKTEHYNRLMPSGQYSFQQDIKIKEYKQNARRSWDDSQYAFFLTAPFYENGEVTTDKIEVENYPNGLWIIENGTQVNKFYKKSEPSKFIVIEFKTFGLNAEPTFKVVQKNGLDIKPDFTMVSSWESTQWKVFNNVSSGYVDSPDYIAK